MRWDVERIKTRKVGKSMVTHLYFSVTGELMQFITPAGVPLTSGSVGVYEGHFSIDESWKGMSLEAVFLAAPASWMGGEDAMLIRRTVPLDEGKAQVPAAVLSKAGYVLYAGLSGISGEKEKRSTLALVGRIRQGAEPVETGSGEISENQYQALLQEIKSMESGGSALFGEEPGDRDIPMLFFGGALPQTKTAKTMSFRYVSATEDISGYVSTKAQGNSSMRYPKKNQTVKLYSDEGCTKKLKLDFKDWGKQSKFCCKANWIDITHARNIVSARLWGDVVKSRADYEDLPELLRTSPNQGAIDGFPVKVYADGIYQGRYTLNIPKDKWMANMDDTLNTHCILCGENYVSGCFRASAGINGSDWTDEIHDTVPETIKTRWNQVISFVMNSSDEEFTAGLSDYFYVDSLIDYHLFGLISCGLDAYGKNQLYMTYDGQKWIASMYDMDSTWGLWYDGSKFVAADYDRSAYEDFRNSNGNLLYIRLEQLFCEQLQSRWAELKAGALSRENILRRFEQFVSIAPKDLVAEDYASNTAGGSFTGIPSTAANTIRQIRAYAVDRWSWCDGYVAGLTSDSGTAEPEDATVTTLTVTPVSGYTLFENDTLEDVKAAINVTATYSDLSEAGISNYTVSGTLTAGTQTFTIAYEGVSVTVDLTVTAGERTQTVTVSLADIAHTSDYTLFKNVEREMVGCAYSDYIAVAPGSSVTLLWSNSGWISMINCYDMDKVYVSDIHGVYGANKEYALPETAYYIRVNGAIDLEGTPVQVITYVPG